MSGYTTTAAAVLHERDALLVRALYLGGIVEAVCVELGLHHDVTAAEVVAAIQALSPAPRVWLPGDTVPAGVAVIDESGAEAGEFWGATPFLGSRFDRPVVELHVPDVAASAAAEQARRAGGAA